MHKTLRYIYFSLNIHTFLFSDIFPACQRLS